MQVTKDRLLARMFAADRKIMDDLSRDPESHPELSDSAGLWRKHWQWGWTYRWPSDGRPFRGVRGYRRWVWGWLGISVGVLRDSGRRSKENADG